jgi:hypothetical protein
MFSSQKEMKIREEIEHSDQDFIFYLSPVDHTAKGMTLGKTLL